MDMSDFLKRFTAASSAVARSWVRRLSRTAEVRTDQASIPVCGVLAHLDEAVHMTRDTVERARSGATEDAYVLLGRRAATFALAGSAIGKATVRFDHHGAAEAGVLAGSDLRRLHDLAMQLGRLDAWIDTHLENTPSRTEHDREDAAAA